jgi:hypothetical protein
MRRLILLISVGWLPPYLFPSGAYHLTSVEGRQGLQSETGVTPLTVAAPLPDPWVFIDAVRAQLSCATGCVSARGTFLAHPDLSRDAGRVAVGPISLDKHPPRMGVARAKCFASAPPAYKKSALLFGEYMNEQPLLLLLQSQMVFTFPKMLRAFFRHGRKRY